MVTFDDEKEKKELGEVKLQEEEELIKFLAEKHGLPYINLVPISIENDALRLVSEAEARASKLAAFAITGKKVKVAIFTPNTPEVQVVLKNIENNGYTIELYLTATRSLEKAWSHYKEISHAMESRSGTVEMSAHGVKEAAVNIKHLQDVIPQIQEVAASKEQNRISRLVEVIMGASIALGASDIHLEPEEDHVQLRFRLDGILQEVTTFDLATYGLMNSRIKLLSGLKLNVKAEAQDGRFSVDLGDTAIEIRTSMLPGAYGESIVMRLLDPKSISVPLESLGMHPILLDAVQKEISKPNGMLLTTGPTGSGKTTTLYAFLRKIHTPGVKIITIEDPIEYHLAGIVQTQVEAAKHYTFASGLRAALRQDPDVIMVGEIRDGETAEVAINASLTGHLVFSTLHTNNAAGTFPRLIDLGANPKTMTSAITLAMAQRLVRKLCEACKKETLISDGDQARFAKMLENLPASAKPTNTTKMWVATGCDKCNNLGYKGRTGVYEAIRTDEALEKVVRENPSEREIEDATRSQGIPNMTQDGILKILSGMTSLEELGRVVNLE
ncbi:MAG: type II/IV secretion system protein [Candidatus Taylorbacteria bacterium]|nr:type II/IV secretion system protein [Candidatus Taylorbacteria bacterium]